MEFNLEYNEISNRNRNLFYFKNYCLDTREFKDWLNYNDISFIEYEDLNKELGTIYLKHKYKIISSKIKRYRQLLDSNALISIEQLEEIYKHYYKNRYYINIFANRGSSLFKNYYLDYIVDIQIVFINNST